MSSDSGSGGFDLGSLLSQLGQVQQNLQQAQAEAAATEVEGTSGGGSVKVRVTGGLEFVSVKIDPAVIDPDDVEMLEDLVLAAVRDGVEKASGLATGALGSAGLAGLPDLGGLGGLGGLGPGLGGGPAGPGQAPEGGKDGGPGA
jgi:DNA-binding YbaB/EbfC family protein